jgi:hypothetical protein
MVQYALTFGLQARGWGGTIVYEGTYGRAHCMLVICQKVEETAQRVLNEPVTSKNAFLKPYSEEVKRTVGTPKPFAVVADGPQNLEGPVRGPVLSRPLVKEQETEVGSIVAFP